MRTNRRLAAAGTLAALTIALSGCAEAQGAGPGHRD
jgi:hypothetical protein